MEKLIDLKTYPVQNVLKLLLKDKTTGNNIIWATDTYKERGEGFLDTDELAERQLYNNPDTIRPRIAKSQDEQEARTRKKAEVFTPVWLCCEMNNYCDDEWFSRKNVFNLLHEDHTWEVSEGNIEFTDETGPWQKYIDSRRLEITCGEAPFLVSRYDAATGELIVPPKRRIGMLDRKLRVVNENTENFDDWMTWTIRSFQAVYGYEYQGDSLLIARINLLNTFVDYYTERWEKLPDDKELRKIANIISWNIWQMDGLTDATPLGRPQRYEKISLFDMADDKPERKAMYCKIQDWRAERPVIFHDLKRG